MACLSSGYRRTESPVRRRTLGRSRLSLQAAIDRENAAMQQERTRMDNELLRELTRKRNVNTLRDNSDRKGKYGGDW